MHAPETVLEAIEEFLVYVRGYLKGLSEEVSGWRDGCVYMRGWGYETRRSCWVGVLTIQHGTRQIAPHHKHNTTQHNSTKEYATNVAALVDSKLEKAKNYVEQVLTD
jgi:hypothetical protein